MHVCSVAHLCLTLWPPGSSVRGILQARILEWVAIAFSGDLPTPGMRHYVPALARSFFTTVPPGRALLIVIFINFLQNGSNRWFSLIFAVILWGRYFYYPKPGRILGCHCFLSDAFQILIIFPPFMLITLLKTHPWTTSLYSIAWLLPAVMPHPTFLHILSSHFSKLLTLHLLEHPLPMILSASFIIDSCSAHSCFFFFFFLSFFIVVDFVIHWNETAMGLHVFPILIPPPTSLSTRSL